MANLEVRLYHALERSRELIMNRRFHAAAQTINEARKASNILYDAQAKVKELEEMLDAYEDMEES